MPGLWAHSAGQGHRRSAIMLAVIQAIQQQWASPLARQSTATLAVMAGSYGVSFGVSVLLARLLGATGYGYYAYLLVWLSILVNLATLGADRVLVRDLGVFAARRDWTRLWTQWAWANRLTLGASLIVAAAVSLALALWPGRIDAEQRSVLGIGMAALPFLALTLVRQAALQSLGQSAVGQLPERLARPALAAAIAAGLYLWQRGSLSAVQAAVALIVAAALALGISQAWLWRCHLPAAPARKTDAAQAWLSSGARLMLTILLAVLGEQTTLLVLGAFAGPADVAVYSVAASGSRIVAMGLLALNVPLGPRLAQLHASGDRAALAALVRRSRRVALLVTGAFFIVLVVFRDVFLGLFGPEFRAGGLTLMILCVGQLVNGASGPVGLVLSMTGHERDVVVAMVVNVALGLTASAVLVPRWGAAGAALVASTALVVWNVYLTYMVGRRHGIGMSVP